jgi:hypothetical protein
LTKSLDQFRDISLHALRQKKSPTTIPQFLQKGTSQETFLGIPCGTIDQELEFPLCKNS